MFTNICISVYVKTDTNKVSMSSYGLLDKQCLHVLFSYQQSTVLTLNKIQKLDDTFSDG